ncbi:hypothetical protein K502DRAFT_72904 [Neoconidiobolus thromboides FSU 785]|nr:hypothetical protein K502DRAFT_72904 [Neoconidiobolus thromboides FSU 785]
MNSTYQNAIFNGYNFGVYSSLGGKKESVDHSTKSKQLRQKLINHQKNKQLHFSCEAVNEAQLVDTLFFATTVNVSDNYSYINNQPNFSYSKFNELIDSSLVSKNNVLESTPIFLTLSLDYDNIDILSIKIRQSLEEGISGFIVNSYMEKVSSIGNIVVLVPIATLEEIIMKIHSLSKNYNSDPLIMIRTHIADSYFISTFNHINDKKLILGATNEGTTYYETIQNYKNNINEGKSFLNDFSLPWSFQAAPMTFEKTLEYHLKIKTKSPSKAKQIKERILTNKGGDPFKNKDYVKDIIPDFYWNPEDCKTEEGYYQVANDVASIHNRLISCLNISDGVIIRNVGESTLTNIDIIAQLLKRNHPDILLGYEFSNLDPYYLCDNNCYNVILDYAEEYNKMGISWQTLSWSNQIKYNIPYDPRLRTIFCHLISQALTLMKPRLFDINNQANVLKNSIIHELRRSLVPQLIGIYNYFGQTFYY